MNSKQYKQTENLYNELNDFYKNTDEYSRYLLDKNEVCLIIDLFNQYRFLNAQYHFNIKK